MSKVGVVHSKVGVVGSKACEYGLFEVRSSIGRGLGDWNIFDFFQFVGTL